MKVFALKIINKPWFFPLALLLLGIIAYAWAFPWLGFYWDDWQAVNLYYMHNPEIGFQYYFRPLGMIPYLILFPVAKMTPIVWQTVAMLLRWGSVLFIYYTLNLVWPSRQKQNRWVAALLFVFPGFLDQPVSVAFSQHLFSLLLFSCSLFLTGLALKQRKLFWLWMPLSVLLGGLQMFIIEYFVGLEIARPILIWFILRSERKEKLGRTLWKTLLYWTPFVLVLIPYLYWRLVYVPALRGGDANDPVLLKMLISSPLKGISTFLVMAYQDVLHLLLYVWPKAFLDTEKMDITTKRVWISWLCGAAACVAFFFYDKFSQKKEQGDDHSTAQQIFLGVVILLCGTAPVWATGEQISVGKWSERFALAPMLGVAIVVVYCLEWLLKTHRQRQILLTILLGISVSAQVFNQILFKDDWEEQREIYWQLHWRIPSLKKGTALFGRGTFTDKSSYYDALHVVNLLFEGTTQLDPNYSYFDTYHEILDDYVPGIPLIRSFGGGRLGQFSGNTSQAIVFDFNSRGSCVRVLDGIYEGDPDLSSSVADLIDISDVDNIAATSDTPLLRAVFGAEPAHTWCYYFEKADLARQMQDWEAVLQLKAEADSMGFTPNVGAEYLPFIEAYAQSKQWKQAYQLSVAANEINPPAGTALCNAWQRYAQFDTSEKMLAYTAKAELEFCAGE